MAEEKINIEPVYISYASKSKRIYDEYAKHKVTLVDNRQERDTFVNNLEKSLKLPGINYKIDREDVEGGSITDFENEIGNAAIVVVVLSDKYFISPHCMYEFDMIHKSKTTPTGKVKKIYYTYFDGEIITAEDGTVFKGADFPMKNINLDYYHKVILPFWKERFEKLKEQYFKSDKHCNLSDVEAYFCNHDTNEKSIKKDGNPYLFETTFLDMHNKLSEVSLVKDDRDLAQFIKDHILINQPKVTAKYNWDRLGNLQERKPCVEGLLKKLRQYPYVNITGVGGYGKTTLANLLVFDSDKKIKPPFLNVAYFVVENNVKKAVVNQFKNSDFCTPELKQKLDKWISTDSLDSKYKDVMECLGKCSSLGDWINLFILDINDYDVDLMKSFADKLIDNKNQTDDTRLYPKGWNVLFVSREPVTDDKKVYNFNIDYNIDKTDKINNDIDYLKDIFSIVKEENSRIYNSYYDCNGKPNKQLIQLFEYLRYSPQLIKMLSFKIDKYTKDVYKDLLGTTEKKARDKYEKFNEDEIKDQKTRTKYLRDYLNNLIRLNKLSKGEQRLLTYFMVWPAGSDIKGDVVKCLTEQCCAIETDELRELAFKEAESKGHLICKNDFVYSLHGMLADTLKQQFFERFSFPLFRYLWYRFGVYKRFKQYIVNCESVLSKVSLNDLDSYVNCIVESVYNNDIGNTDNLKNHPKLRTFTDIKNIKKEIEILEQRGQSFDLAIKYLKLGELYYNNPKDYSKSDALVYIHKAVEFLSSTLFDGDTTYDKPDKQRFESFEMIQDLIQGVKISDNRLCEFMGNVYSRMGDWYFREDDDIALEKYNLSIRFFEDESIDDYTDFCSFTKRNIANAYYRYALMLDLSNNKAKSSSFFVEADRIWASFSPETEGNLKGFVKTSYGIYDPEFGFKLVKVEKGSFDMGISEEEIKKCKLNDYQFGQDEFPCHSVAVEEDFYIGMYPVTQGEWEKCVSIINNKTQIHLSDYKAMQKDGYNNQLAFLHKRYGSRVNHLTQYKCDGIGNNNPMNYVSAKDADDFIQGINALGKKYTLPTEIQWEYAARGGSRNERFLFSGVDEIELCADSGKGSITEDGNTAYVVGPSVVGSLRPNILGIYDMSGNVYEWCQDWYKADWYNVGVNRVCSFKDVSDVDYVEPYLEKYYFNGQPVSSSDFIRRNYDQSFVSDRIPARVLRGGSWNSRAQNCLVSGRYGGNPGDRSDELGFRLSLSLQTEKEEK